MEVEIHSASTSSRSDLACSSGCLLRQITARRFLSSVSLRRIVGRRNPGSGPIERSIVPSWRPCSKGRVEALDDVQMHVRKLSSERQQGFWQKREMRGDRQPDRHGAAGTAAQLIELVPGPAHIVEDGDVPGAQRRAQARSPPCRANAARTAARRVRAPIRRDCGSASAVPYRGCAPPHAGCHARRPRRRPATG